MKSPLETYKDIANKFNITNDKKIPNRMILAYVVEQTNQQKMIVNRLLCDASKATIDSENAKDDTTKAAYNKQLSGFEDDVRQLSKTLDFFIKIEQELRADYKGDEPTPADYPEA